MSAKLKVGDRIRLKTDQIDNVTAIRHAGKVVTICEAYDYGYKIKEEKSPHTLRRSRFEDELYVEPKPEKPKRDYVADHARRTLRAAGFTKEQAAAWVVAYNARPEDDQYREDAPASLSELSRSLPSNARDAAEFLISYSFRWDTTPQGWQYWNTVHDELTEKESNAQTQ